jgi:hypothetical protein
VKLIAYLYGQSNIEIALSTLAVRQLHELVYDLVLDMAYLTHITVLSNPIMMLWHSKSPLRQKLILFPILLIAVVVVIISIIRVAVTHSINENFEFSCLYFWSIIEMATGMLTIYPRS